MSDPADLPRTLRFGRFELNLRTAELYKEGKRIRLQEQPCQVLALLLEHRGELVSREELRKRLWPDNSLVDFDHGVNIAINKLRDALGDSPDKPRFIETLPRRGYRFIAAIDALDNQRDAAPLAGATKRLVAGAGYGSTTWRRALLLGLPALSIAVAFFFFVEYWQGRGADNYIRSLVVLPLENLSADSQQEYFADGMTDELITDLGKIGDLRVISRTSAMHYKGTRKTLPEIARELKVDAVVEGGVLRSGDRVRITAQLVEASTDRHLWAESYERELNDVLALQSEVARVIATQIRVKLTQHLQLASVQKVNPGAYDYYLKGRYSLSERPSKEGGDNAIRYFELAIERDPNYAPPYAGLAYCYAVGTLQGMELPPREAWSKGAAAASKALELDEQLAEAHIAMANVRFRFDWNWPEAEREFHRGLELSPNDALGHLSYSYFLGIMGRLDDAMAEATRAHELDPLSPRIGMGMTWIYHWSRQQDKAIAESRRILQADPNWTGAHDALVRIYEEKGMYRELVDEELKVEALTGRSPEQIESLRDAFAASGIKGFWQKRLEWEERQLNHPHYFDIARLCVFLGRTDEAFVWLEKAYGVRYPNMPNIKVAALWLDPLRSDSRYADLLRRVGLPP